PLFCRVAAEVPANVRSCSNILLQDVVHFANRIGDKSVGLGLAGETKSSASIGRCAYMSLIRRGGFAVGVIAFAGVAGLLGSAAADTATVTVAANVQATQPITSATSPDDYKKMMMQYCTACHNDRLKTAGMSV